MALTVSAPNNPTLTIGNAVNPTITGVGNANGTQYTSLLPKAPAAPAAQPAAAPDPYAAALASLKASQQVAAPTPNFDAINKNATARANTDVNPIYTKYINDFMAQQAQQNATQEAIKNQNIQNAQDVLKQTQTANTVTGQRTTEDTATKEAQAAQATDWRQTDQGGQYDIDRVAQAVAQAKAGTTGSGIAGGQNQTTQDAFNTKESRQATQDQQTQQATELAKARTFEDLATSNTNAASQEGKSETAAKFDLSTFMQQQTQQLQDEQQKLEQQRQAQVASTQAQYVKSGFQDFFNKISNPAQKAAFAQAYGSYL